MTAGTCTSCTHQDKPRATLVDGRQVCTWCEDWRHECEARHVLGLPSLNQRRAYLYGRPEQKFGRTMYVGGIEQKRGQDAVKRLEATMTALWERRKVDARAAVMNRQPGTPLAANDHADTNNPARCG